MTRAFAVIFVAEWGDLTQLATATLAARHGRPLTVFLGATAALWSVASLPLLASGVQTRHHGPHALRHACAPLGFLSKVCR